jgi:hypothetical protein
MKLVHHITFTMTYIRDSASGITRILSCLVLFSSSLVLISSIYALLFKCILIF